MASMLNLLLVLLHTVLSSFKSHRHLALENLALRQQHTMLKQSVKRPRASPTDRLFWVLLSKYVDGWRTMLHTLQPDTVVRRHREGFLLHILPKGLMRIRHYGFLANRCRNAKLALIRIALAKGGQQPTAETDGEACCAFDGYLCPECRIGRLRVIGSLPPLRFEGG